jgi:hypothetical protein
MLEKYENKKNALLNAYDMIINSDNFDPDTGIFDITEKEKIKDKKQDLIDGKFIVAIAGQMKAGKSTLLNAMIFKDQVLPVADTVKTAKITFLEYGKENKVDVTFYTESEFNEVREFASDEFNKMSEFSKVENKFENSIKKSLKDLGIADFSDILAQKNKILSDFSDLDNYVGADGLYTPFVNTITIYAPNEWLKNVIVVDTPGTNDPNSIREKTTTDWIHKSNAVLFCTYAGSAMGSEDIKFIDKHLAHIPENKRIFAVTKTDVAMDVNNIKSYLDKIIESDWNRERKLINKGSMYPVIQLLGLIKRMPPAKVKQDEVLVAEYSRLKRLNFTDDGLDNLEAAIEKTLIDSSESALLQSHEHYLESLYNREFRELCKDIEDTEQKINNAGQDVEEVEQRLKKIRVNSIDINAKFEETKIKTEQIAKNDIVVPINEFLTNMIDQTSKKLETKLNHCGNVKILKCHYTGDIKTIIDVEVYNKIRPTFNEIIKQPMIKMSKSVDEIIQLLQECSFKTTHLTAELANMSDNIIHALVNEKFEIDMTSVADKFFWVWNKTDKLNGYIAAIVGQVKDMLNEKYGSKMRLTLSSEIIYVVNSALKDLASETNNRVKNFAENLEENLKDKDNREKHKESYEKELNKLLTKKQQTEDARQELRKVLK